MLSFGILPPLLLAFGCLVQFSAIDAKKRNGDSSTPPPPDLCALCHSAADGLVAMLKSRLNDVRDYLDDVCPKVDTSVRNACTKSSAKATEAMANVIDNNFVEERICAKVCGQHGILEEINSAWNQLSDSAFCGLSEILEHNDARRHTKKGIPNVPSGCKQCHNATDPAEDHVNTAVDNWYTQMVNGCEGLDSRVSEECIYELRNTTCKLKAEFGKNFQPDEICGPLCNRRKHGGGGKNED